MRELVLPILHEFKPDIVINSAGQDNHFSDPLANMNVTAKGYAELVDLLQADIAVLEGGYSVQEALPYVTQASSYHGGVSITVVLSSQTM